MSPTDNAPSPFTEDELMAFIKGTAAPSVAERIESARQSDRTLAAEIALMQGLKPALAAATDANPPGEFAWRRLEADIRRERQQPAPQSHTSNRTTLWKAAAVFFAMAAFGQAVYFATAPLGEQAGYETSTKGTDQYVLAVEFKPEATEAEMRALLREIGAQIVDGPGASGLYRIAFETAPAMSDARAKLESAPIIGSVLDE